MSTASSVLEQTSQQPQSGPVKPAWPSQEYVPAAFGPGLVQMLTFRLADALPGTKMRQILETTPARHAHLRIDQYLDAGLGSCVLGRPEIARLMQEILLHFDGERYRLLAWVVMPNHVHALIETLPDYPLAKVMHGWKGFSAYQVNKLLGRTNSLWQRDYFDRYMRDAEHFRRAVLYVHFNPVRAGLVKRMEDYEYSSCGFARSTGV